MSANEPFVSYFDPRFRISLALPADWSAGHTDDFPLILLAPPAMDYRSNLAFSQSSQEIDSPEALDGIIAAAKAEQLAGYPRFRQLKEERFWQDGRPAYLQRYQWQPEDAQHPFVQLFGLVLVGPGNLLEINGATLQPLAERNLPVLRKIVSSIRFIPE